MKKIANIFIGRSGCGKGTQVLKLIEYFNKKEFGNIFHLEVGERFRQFIKSESYSSGLAKEISDLGGLQPEFLSIWAWANELTNNLKKEDHLFIDGTPRRFLEAKILDTAFDFFEFYDVNIIYVDVSKDWAIDKMVKRGREDDKEMSDIKERLKWFDESVVPVLDYYRSHKSYKFHHIKGEQTVDQVHQDIIKSLNI